MAGKCANKLGRQLRYITRSVSAMLGKLKTQTIDKDVSELVHKAVSQELVKDDEDRGDLETGQRLAYPSVALCSSPTPHPTSSPPVFTLGRQSDSPRVNIPLPSELDVAAVSPDDSSGRKRKRRGKKKKSPPQEEARADNPAQVPAPSTSNESIQDGVDSAHTHKTHAQLGKMKRRAQKRAREKSTLRTNPPPRHKIRPSYARKARAMRTINMQYNAARLKHAAGSYIGLRAPVCAQFKTVEDAVAAGYTKIVWDGKETLLMVDNEGRIVAFGMGPPPDDPTWATTVQQFTKIMTAARAKFKFGKRKDRRGTFMTIASGISYGGGQKRPGTLRHSVHNQAVLKELLESSVVRRIAHRQNAMFAMLAPKAYVSYYNNAVDLQQRYPDLVRNFPKSVFPAASFNFPPNSVSAMHTDHGNRAAGFCPIFCAGDFDYRRGGHLILEDYRLVVEFPPGCMLAIPSASCAHGNIPIHPGESRSSFTQYASGGLFRFVDYGFKTWAQFKATNTPTVIREVEAKRETRWEEELDMFSKLDELETDRVAMGLVPE